jgi:pimeloyl-ACP methyl ester carboxylesterase
MHINVRGHSCSYELYGEGAPITLLHSVGLSTREGWREQIPFLEKTHRVLSYDFRGLGQSTRGDGPLSVDVFVADLKGLLDHLNHKPTVLMGVSLGGFVAQKFALAYPEDVKALILTSTTCRINPDNEERRQERNRRIRAEGMACAVDYQIKSHFPDAFLAAHPGIEPWYRDHYIANNPENYIEIMQDLGRFDVCDDLRRIACPTLIVAGGADATSVAGKAPLESAHMLQAKIPHAQLEIIPQANHYPQIDSSPDFNARIGRFLAKLETKSQRL